MGTLAASDWSEVWEVWPIVGSGVMAGFSGDLEGKRMASDWLDDRSGWTIAEGHVWDSVT